jgi:hypothetical protein
MIRDIYTPHYDPFLREYETSPKVIFNATDEGEITIICEIFLHMDHNFRYISNGSSEIFAIPFDISHCRKTRNEDFV